MSKKEIDKKYTVGHCSLQLQVAYMKQLPYWDVTSGLRSIEMLLNSASGEGIAKQIDKNLSFTKMWKNKDHFFNQCSREM